MNIIFKLRSDLVYFQGITMDETMEVEEAVLSNHQLVPQSQQIILGESHSSASVATKVIKPEPVVRKIQPQIKLVSKDSTSGAIRIAPSNIQGSSLQRRVLVFRTV